MDVSRWVDGVCIENSYVGVAVIRGCGLVYFVASKLGLALDVVMVFVGGS